MAEIKFTKFEAPAKVNPYTETVKALAEQNDPEAAVELIVDVNDAHREQLLFQRAANDINKTARLRIKDESEVTIAGKGEDEVKTGNVRLVFTMTEKHKVRRGKKD